MILQLAQSTGMGWLHYLLATALTIVCFLLIVIVLLQKGRGGGLSAALGGAGGNTAFGAKTGDVFTWITVAFASLYLLLAVLGNYQFRMKTAKPAAPVLSGTAGAAPTGEDDLADRESGTAGPAEPMAPVEDDGLPAPDSPDAGATEDAPGLNPPADEAAQPDSGNEDTDRQPDDEDTPAKPPIDE